MGVSRKPRWDRGAMVALVALLAVSVGCSNARRPASSDATSAENAPLTGGDDLPKPFRPSTQTPDSMAFSTEGPASASPTRAPATTPVPAGPGIRVTWEALAVERQLAENPHFGRRPVQGAMTTEKVVLVSRSHEQARANQISHAAKQSQGVAVAALPDKDMELFFEGLRQRGFFQLAHPTSAVEHLFDDPNARGRVTVEKDGQSWSLVSMRGQGLNPSTRKIPALYSELKQAIMVLRNETPTLTVMGVERQPLR